MNRQRKWAYQVTVAQLQEAIDRAGVAEELARQLINPATSSSLTHSASHITNDDITRAQRDVIAIKSALADVRRFLTKMKPEGA